MNESQEEQVLSSNNEPQCQFFVMRKKRLCRMTVRPGRQYCGEHEPQPKTTDGQDDTRIPCPNDPKHTVYLSKLEKHLSICNARVTEQPSYIVQNINAPTEMDTCVRIPLGQLSQDSIIQVIEKVNFLYDKHVKDNITVASEHPIHRTVMEEFLESDRGESSLRHLRQVSSLLWLAEDEGLVANNTCYVELGAGKGHMSYYACTAWCAAGGGALLVERAALRHKRDNKLRGRRAWRLRADLAHLALARVPLVADCSAVVGLAKHLCGVATDYALRCLTAEGVVQKVRGAVVATCCHHRCERSAYVANRQLQELGINGDELNVMLGIVSWATCGDGRSRGARTTPPAPAPALAPPQSDPAPALVPLQSEPAHAVAPPRSEPAPALAQPQSEPAPALVNRSSEDQDQASTDSNNQTVAKEPPSERPGLTQEQREQVGRRAKQLLDWARVLYLRGRGFDARLCYYVPTTVSLENVCIVAKKLS